MKKNIFVVKCERILSVTFTLNKSEPERERERESDIAFRFVLFTLSGSEYLSSLHLFSVNGHLL